MNFQGIGEVQGISHLKNTYNSMSLSQTTNATDYATMNKHLWFTYYAKLFSNLATSFFLYENLPSNIPSDFIEKELFYNGYVGLVESETSGFFAVDGVMTEEFNIYKKNSRYKVNTPVELKRQLNIKDKYDIIYPENKEFIWGYDSCIILGNTINYEPYASEVMLFCEKLAMIELAIQQNRMILQKPFIVIGDDDNMNSVENIFKSIFNVEPYQKVKLQKKEDGTEEYRQMKDFISTLNLGGQSHLSELQDEKQRVIGQVLTLLSINNINIDKSERLTYAESVSNNGLLSASNMVRLKPRKDNIETFNLLTGENVTVTVNPMISNFNIDEFSDEIEKDIEGEYNE